MLRSSASLGACGDTWKPQGNRFSEALACILWYTPVVVSGAGSVLLGPRWSGISRRNWFMTACVSGSEPALGPWYVSLQGELLEQPVALQTPHRNGKLRLLSVPRPVKLVQPFE